MEDARDQAARRGAAAAAVDGGALQLGVRLGNDAADAIDVDHRHAPHAQRAQQHVVGRLRVHGLFRDQRELALHARVDDEVAAGVAGQRTDDGRQVGIDEVQVHIAGGVRPRRPRLPRGWRPPDPCPRPLTLTLHAQGAEIARRRRGVSVRWMRATAGSELAGAHADQAGCSARAAARERWSGAAQPPSKQQGGQRGRDQAMERRPMALADGAPFRVDGVRDARSACCVH